MDISSGLLRSSGLDAPMRRFCSFLDPPVRLPRSSASNTPVSLFPIGLDTPRRQPRSSVLDTPMGSYLSYDMWDLQSMEKVIEPLNEGIVSICNICKCLLDAQVDPNTGMCSNYKRIRGHIEHAEQYMARSEETIKLKLQNLDERMQQLIKEQGNAEQQEQQKRQTKNQLQLEKNSAEESLNNSKAALEQATTTLALTKKEIKREEDRRVEGGWVTVAGVGVTMIPVFGWVMGPKMIQHGLSTMMDATEAIRRAEEYCEENKSKVWEKMRKVSEYESKISDIQDEIEETDELLKKFQSEIEEVKQHLDFTADIQEMVRRAVKLLSFLSGRVTVLERQTRRFIVWQPVIKVMEDVMKAVVDVAKNRLLYSHGVEGLINTLRGNVRGLLALGYSTRHSANDDYC